ncbi:hypothetical protein [Micromonospora profundi]|uniref:hypothetical protein n=1 Tax=Micromonospora profundi TaxID=1420889 RepID=UPI0036C8C9B2
MSSPNELPARLQQITADLDGYLDRRARELAAPIIAEQQATADAVIAGLRRDLESAESRLATAREVIVHLEDRLDELRAK